MQSRTASREYHHTQPDSRSLNDCASSMTNPDVQSVASHVKSAQVNGAWRTPTHEPPSEDTIGRQAILPGQRFMPKPSDTRKIAFLGDYLPRKCGIATFTSDLRCAVATEFPAMQCLVVPVNDLADGYDYPPEVRFEIAEQDLPSYLRAADFLNITDVDVVCVEHEFGIFGGQIGRHVL